MENIISKEQMDAMKVLVDTNMKISEAKGILFRLQETETAYLEEREKKSIEKVGKLFDDSNVIVQKIRENNGEINQLHQTASELVKFLSDSHERFTKLVELFNEKDDLWQKKVSKVEEDFELIKQDIKNDQVRIKNAKRFLEIKEKSLKDQETLIKDRHGALERTIKFLNK